MWSRCSSSPSSSNARETVSSRSRSSRVSGDCGPGCSVTAEVNNHYGVLEMDENDNSFLWGLIHHSELVRMLNVGLSKTLLIDSRSFLEFNTSNIQQSVNVCCSKLVKRRLQQDKVHVLDLLSQTCMVGADESWDVIVYDQCTEDPSLLTGDNFVHVLLEKLSTFFNSVAFLKGGFLAFQASHPSLVTKSSSHKCSTLTSLSQPCMPVSNVGPTRILPFMYLGSQQDALSLEMAQVCDITYILNVSKQCPKPGHILESHFHRIPVNDNYCEKLLPYFQEAFAFLDKVREANGCVLVHCLGGVSRSATLAIAYIMKCMNMSSDEAYRYVKDKRPTISPNFNFLGQLLEFEKLRGRESDEDCSRGETFQLYQSSADERPSRNQMDLHTSSPSSPGPRSAQSFDLPAIFSSTDSDLLSSPSTFTQGFSNSRNKTKSPTSPLAFDRSTDKPLRDNIRFYQNCLPSPGVNSQDFLTSSVQPNKIRAPIVDEPLISENVNFIQDCPFPGPDRLTGYEQSQTGSSLPSSNNLLRHIDTSSPVSTPIVGANICPISGFPSPNSVVSPPLIEQYNDSNLLTRDSISLKESLTDSGEIPSHLSKTDQAEGHISPKQKQLSQKTKQGFSLSSMFSSFKWRSRPPSLNLGSPVTSEKSRFFQGYCKKSNCDSKADRAKLTPVSEAMETSDLSPANDLHLPDESSSHTPIDSDSHIISQTTDLLSTQNNSPILTSTLGERDSIKTITDISSQIISSPPVVITENPTKKRKSPKLNPKNFRLPLSSPTSEFPIASTHGVLSSFSSPGDSNKRKIIHQTNFLSPDKLAKKDESVRHSNKPPSTLSLSSERHGKIPPKKPSVLHLSSPTAAMAKLNFASPSEHRKDFISSSELAFPKSQPNSKDIKSDSSASTNNSLSQGCTTVTAALTSVNLSSFSCSMSSSYHLSSSSSSYDTNSDLSWSTCSTTSYQGFSKFPTTSLDKLNFTPCSTKDIVQEFHDRQGTDKPKYLCEKCDKHETGSDVKEPGDSLATSVSALDSPMSISSNSSAPSIASSTVSPVEASAQPPFHVSENIPRPVSNQSEVRSSHDSESIQRPATLFEGNSAQSISACSPDSVLSPNFLPQATLSPSLPTPTSPSYCSSPSMDPLSPLSPMSLSDSPSFSPLRSPTSNTILTDSNTAPRVAMLHSSSSSIHATTASSKVVLRRDKSRRPLVRPNSIAFSSYPACDLVPNSSDASGDQSTKDDASASYMSGMSKRYRPTATCDPRVFRGRTSFGGYSEREMYKQITAAMENAMLQTQAYALSSSRNRRKASRKTRSLDDILDTNTEEDLSSTRTLDNFPRYDACRCSLRTTSEPYHSSSSLSSNGSHGSMHSSLEIIQVS